MCSSDLQFQFYLLLKRSQVLASGLLWFCLGDTKHFFACSIVISVLFNDTLCLSLFISRVLKVGSHLAHLVVLFLTCLWAFCFFDLHLGSFFASS